MHYPALKGGWWAPDWQVTSEQKEGEDLSCRRGKRCYAVSTFTLSRGGLFPTSQKAHDKGSHHSSLFSFSRSISVSDRHTHTHARILTLHSPLTPRLHTFNGSPVLAGKEIKTCTWPLKGRWRSFQPPAQLHISTGPAQLLTVPLYWAKRIEEGRLRTRWRFQLPSWEPLWSRRQWGRNIFFQRKKKK